MTRPRGPLPARVYWTRRILLLVLALGLVVGIEHLLGGSGGSGSPSAKPVGADVSSSPASPSPSAPAGRSGGRGTPSPAASPLAEPTGSCPDSDIVVTPTVPGEVYAGSPVDLDLQLTTEKSPACTWSVSPQTLVVKLTSGADRIWSTQDCPGVIHKQDVVVRKDVPTSVTVTWRGRRSDGTCSATNAWAQPGYYYVTAAALGAEPDQVQFVLRTPVAPTITPTPSPSPSVSGSAAASSSASPKTSPSASPSKTD